MKHQCENYLHMGNCFDQERAILICQDCNKAELVPIESLPKREQTYTDLTK